MMYQKNEYSFTGDDDLIGRMFAYELDMKKYDLSTKVIKKFGFTVYDRKIEEIKNLFTQLNALQKKGLLSIYLDYFDLTGGYNFGLIGRPSGSAISIATTYKHEELLKFLSDEKNSLEDLEKTATTSMQNVM